MSNQRSCILFVVLVIILFYLYYESIQKNSLKTREKLLVGNSSSTKIKKAEHKVLYGRQLLSYSTENAAEINSVEEVWSHSMNSFNFDTSPEASHRIKYLERTKRNVKRRNGIYKWKFNVSVSKLNDIFTEQTKELKNKFEENKFGEESLNIEIYVDGKTEEFKNLEHSWHAVKNSLSDFYGETNQQGRSSQDFFTQVDVEKSVTKRNFLSSYENSLSLIDQESSEKLVQEETKKVNKSSGGRKAKFLFLDSGGGGSKVNLPLLPENGKTVANEVNTESMHDLSFLNSTELFDIKIEAGLFSSTLLPEHQKLDLPLAEPNILLTEVPKPKLDSDGKIRKHTVDSINRKVSNKIKHCDNCVMHKVRPSTELVNATVDKAVARNINVMQTNLPIDVIDLSPDSILKFCLNFVQSLQKSHRLDEELADLGSGSLDADKNNMDSLKVTNAGNGTLGVGVEIESVQMTAQALKPQQQFGLFQRLWNRILNFRSRNQRNEVEDLDEVEDLRFPTEFSVKDCNDLFAHQLKSELNTQTTLEESTFTETNSIPLFSQDSIVSAIINSSKNNLDFFQKTNAAIDKKNTVIPHLFAKIPGKATIESTSGEFQNFPSFKGQILATDESIMNKGLKKAELIENLNTITLTEEISNYEDSVELQKSLTESSLNLRKKNISTKTSEDLKQDKRFFSDFHIDDILEPGSSDERIMSDNVTKMQENDLKEVTFDQKSLSQQKLFSNFLNAGSGEQELPESFSSTDISINKNEFILSETNVQSISDSKFPESKNTVDFMQTSETDKGQWFIPNFSEGSGARELSEYLVNTDTNMAEFNLSEISVQSISGNIFLEKENALKKTTVDFIRTPMTNIERRFIPNLFNKGSGDSELPESVSLDVTFKTNEINLSETNLKSTSDDIFLLRENALRKATVYISKAPITDKGQIFFPNLFSEGSGTHELPEMNFTIIYDKVFIEELSKTKIVSNDSLINTFTEPSSIDYFDTDSGEGKLEKTEAAIETKNLNIGFHNDSASFPDFIVSFADINNWIEGENTFNKTDPPNQHKLLMNEIDDVFLTQYRENFDQNLVFRSSGDRRIPEISFNETPLISDKREIPVNNTSNITISNIISTICNNCENLDNDRFSATAEYSLTRKPCVNCSNASIEIPESQNMDTFLLTTKIYPLKSKHSNKASDFTSYSQDLKKTYSTLSNLNPRLAPANSAHKIPDSYSNENFKFIELVGGADTFKMKPESQISSKSLPARRGARFDFPIFTSNSERVVSAIPMSPTQSVNLFQQKRGARGHDLFDLEIDFVSTEQTEETLEAVNTFTEIEPEQTLNYTLTVENHDVVTKLTDSSKISPDVTSKSFVSSVTNLIPHQKIELNLNPALQLPFLKFCHSASECNVTLNERCMPKNDLLICNCGKAFGRNLETKKCEATITVQTSIVLPSERFYEGLRNRNSKLYQQKKIDSIKMMWFLLKHDPKLFRTVAEVDVTSFEEGSLIVNYTLKLLNNSNSELIQGLERDLNKVINEQQQKNKSLKNATISIFVLNPCSTIDMNYCHKNALCIPIEGKGFKCRCKPDYLDTSRDKTYPGENCTGFCDDSKCGTHGKCYVIDNEGKQCRCSDWYLGERCEINGLIVIACFAFASFLVISLSGLVLFSFKKSRNLKLCNRDMVNFQHRQDPYPTRDDRGIDERTHHCRMSKFLAISTPLYEAPTIQVTSPSFTGSSIDYDSTFDRSPYSSEASRNENCIALKV